MKKIRAAIVGYGNIGRYALEALEAANDFEVAGIVKNIPEFRNILIKDCVCTGGNIGVVVHGLT